MKTIKHLQATKYKIFKLPELKIIFGLPDHSHKAGDQTKQCTAISLHHKANSPRAFAYWCSDLCVPSAPCLSFYLFDQAGHHSIFF